MRSNATLRQQRSIDVIAATLVLAVPGSAVALTGATAAAGASSGQSSAPPPLLRVSPRWAEFNQPVTITGQVPGWQAGQRIRLETALARHGSWRPMATTRVNPGGGFRFRLPVRRSGFLRVTEAAAAADAVPGARGSGAAPAAAGSGTAPAAAGSGTAPSAAGSGATVSPGSITASAAYPVSVAAQIQVAPRAVNVLSGSGFTVRGRLLPALAGRPVRLEGHFATGWRTLASGRTGPAGRFGLHLRAASGLERRLRVRFAGDRFNTESAQPAGRLTVYGLSVASWYDDTGTTACGFHAGLGVANRSLPCGTKVGFRYGGHSVTAVVDDRGPFVGGRRWDLNQNTAAALGFGGVDTVWSTQ